MKDLVGIKSLLEFKHSDISDIKKYLLLFDSVGVYDLRTRIDDARQKHNHKHICPVLIIADELEYLLEKKLVHDMELKGHGAIRREEATPSNFKTFYALLENNQRMFENNDIGKDLKFDAFNRLQSFILNIEKPTHPFEAIPVVKQIHLPANISAGKGDVINLVIEHFPIPKGELSFEQLIEFKNDKDNIGRLAGLRVWINSLSKAGMTINEITDELEYKLYQYQKSLEAHKIKYESGMIETFIVGAAELLENVIKLRLGDVARGLFRARDLKADLLLAELEAPGHELGYIYKVENKLK